MIETKYRAAFMPVFGRDNIFYSDEFEDINCARAAINAIAEYTLFLHESRLMKDYSNAGWVEQFEDGEWIEIEDDEE